MSMTGKRSHTLVLSGDAGIKSAQDVAQSLRDAIESHAQVSVDTQTLGAADITTIQTLLAARAFAAARNKSLTLLAPLGQNLEAVLQQAGFLAPGQEHAGFWSTPSDQPAGH